VSQLAVVDDPSVRLLACGELAVLVELTDLAAVLAAETVLSARVADAAPEDPWRHVEIVPAARTVLVRCGRVADLAGIREELPTLLADLDSAAAEHPGELVEIQVHYDGPDLGDVACHLGMSVDDVVAAHTGTEWRVAFGGFAPGFAYLAEGDPRLDVPRRSQPRTKVPAGAVALAGTFSGVYPRVSPGGWQLIGHTEAVLWDVERDPAALLRPGCVVRFSAVTR
jgi:KipI family sensor histidine kinase inhibitor